MQQKENSFILTQSNTICMDSHLSDSLEIKKSN